MLQKITADYRDLTESRSIFQQDSFFLAHFTLASGSECVVMTTKYHKFQELDPPR